MTLRAAQPFPRMFGMAEVTVESDRGLRGPNKSSLLVTRRARADILVPHHRSRAVTLKTCDVSIGARWNRKRNASARGFMTGRAVRQPQVTTVIEDCVEAPKRRKSLDVGRGVADRADRMLISGGELLRVTRSARNMPRHLWGRAAFTSYMADETWHTFMLLCLVGESRKVLGRRFR